MNIQSIRNKIDELQCTVKSDILVLVETWLYPSETVLYNIAGYSAVHSCRASRGGGAAIYIKKSIKFTTLECSGSDELVNWVCVSLGESNIRLSAIYRPPSYDSQAFLNSLEAILNKYKSNHIIIGDMNVNLLNSGSLLTQEYKELLTLNRFEIVNSIDVANATRVTELSSTLIDHVLCNRAIRHRCNAQVEDNALSDHKKLTLNIIEKPIYCMRKVCVQRAFINSKKFSEMFLQYNTNIEIRTFQGLIDGIKKAKEKAQSFKKIKIHENNEWITPELLELIKIRDKAYKQHRQNPNNLEFKYNFTKIKNTINNQIKVLKNRYFNHKWIQAGENKKKQWSIINSFIKNSSNKEIIQELEVDGLLISNEQDIVDTLNTYFSQIGCDIVREVENEKNDRSMNVIFEEISCDNNISLEPTNEVEVSEVIMNLKRGAAPGRDGVSFKDLYNIKDHLICTLAVLINNVLSKGVFPDELKNVRICPVFKSGSKTLKNNYRPITLNSIFSKIIEVIIKIRIMSFVDKYVNLDPFQYGFTKNSNTLNATVDFISFLSGELDRGNIVVAVFVDLRKAFDVVDHRLLLSKLERMGFRGVAFKLIKSYLSDRKQYINLGNCSSDVRVNKCGVPQGSVLGPLLYTLFVLSLRLSGLQARYYTFADDTVLVYKSKDALDLQNMANNDLKHYYYWLLHNKLKINMDKTKYIIFKQKNKVVNDIHLQICEHRLTKTNDIKYLGLVLDENLNWNAHVKQIKQRLISMAGALYRCRTFLTTKAKYDVYNAYFLSVLRYLIPVWGSCNNTNFKIIQVLQNKILKILFGLDMRLHTEALYQMLKVQPISQILFLEQAKLIHKVLINKTKINSKIMLNNETHEHNLRNINNIRLETARTNKALHSPISLASEAYNSLPQEIKNARVFTEFINKIKMYVS